MRRHPSAALITLAILACAAPVAAQQPPRPEFIAGDPAMPFSQAVRVGDMIYLSGMIGTENGVVVAGGIQAETRRTMDNIRSALEGLGSSMSNVVKCTVFLADMREWGAMNEVYVTYFPQHKPARSALGASGLALNARVEIECLAVAGRPR